MFAWHLRLAREADNRLYRNCLLRRSNTKWTHKTPSLQAQTARSQCLSLEHSWYSHSFLNEGLELFAKHIADRWRIETNELCAILSLETRRGLVLCPERYIQVGLSFMMGWNEQQPEEYPRTRDEVTKWELFRWYCADLEVVSWRLRPLYVDRISERKQNGSSTRHTRKYSMRISINRL